MKADSVRKWRKRFEIERVAGVGKVAPGRGRKPSISAETIAAIVADTTSTTPADATHWSTRSMAAAHGVGKDTVGRVWKQLGLTPWRIDTFKVSNDPDLEAKLTDVVGLYLDPPERAVVFCFDEKSQVQALQRTQPSLPLTRGRAGTMTHDYKRHGTTTLFAAMNMASGHVINHCFGRHRAKEFLAFLKIVDGQVPRGLEIHMILDNYSTHKHADVVAWLVKPRQKRWHLHFTPTSCVASDLFVMVEPHRALVQRTHREATGPHQLRQRRSSHRHHRGMGRGLVNKNPKPYRWTKPAAEILAKIRRARQGPNHPTQIRARPLAKLQQAGFVV